MYISKIRIKGFRNFNDKEITFNDGINVIIGHNNAGKTNLLKALSLVLDNQTPKRLSVEDFHKNVALANLKGEPPSIAIELSIFQSKEEDLNSDDLVTVGDWLTKLDSPYEAVLTYEFFLPEKEKDKYRKALENVDDIHKAWLVIKHDFIRLYVHKIFGGDATLQTVADSDLLQKFDFQFLDAIRDVERDMFTGKNTLLRDVLDFFMDYEIKSAPLAEKTSEQKIAEIKVRKEAFSVKANELLADLQIRMASGKKHILSYAEVTGASFNKASPDFDGAISDVEMFSALKLIVEYETGIKIPATHNGLGYNNLIFMSLLLAKMQVNCNEEYLGGNAKVFPVLAIEEPEAHLHPSMQYKFLKFLKENIEKDKKVRQIFVTTHSTQITSAVALDEIICMHNENGDTKIGYPGQVFSNDDSSKKSKGYVKRFLDATRSDMLFAQKVIFVEGIAEQLLMSMMAKHMGKSLEDNHIAVINVAGRHFSYFLELFDTTKSKTINKRIACITDRDPVRKKTGGKFEKCYPFENNLDPTNYTYSENAAPSLTKYLAHPNIRFFSQDAAKGKTFEYELVLYNPALELLITDSIGNQAELKELMKYYKDGKPIADFILKLRGSEENKRIIESIEASTWSEEEKKKAIISSRYLNSVGKGENAMELAFVLEDNYTKAVKETFIVPDYIKEAIEWICQ